MTVLPIVHRQLRVACRQRRSYWVRLVAAGVAILFLAGTVSARRIGVYWNGPETFELLAWVAFLYCLVAGGLSTADCLSAERRENTLGLLFLTDLRGYDVALGKYFGSCIPSYLGLLALLPILAVPVLMGGVLFGDFWCVCLSLSATLLFASSVGLAVSVCSRNPFRAAAVTVGLLLTMAFIWPLLAEIVRRIPGWTFLAFGARWVSPFYTQWLAISTNLRFSPLTFWNSLAAVCGWSILVLGITCVVLPRSWQEKVPRETTWRRWLRALRRGALGSQASQRAFRRALLDTHPFAWLAGRGTVSSVGLMSMAVLVVIGAGLISRYVARRLVAAPTVEDQLFIWIWTAVVLHCLVLGKTSSSSSERFAEDLQTGGLELLLCTPLSVREIVRGQRQAWRRQLAGAALLVLLVHVSVVYLVLTEFASVNNVGPTIKYLLLLTFRNAISVSPDGYWQQTFVILLLLASAAVLVLHWVALSWTSGWLSLRLRHPRFAPWAALALVLIPPWLMFIGLVVGMLEMEGTWSAARCTYFNLKLVVGLHAANDLLLIWWARRHLLQHFRLAAARLYAPPRLGARVLRPLAACAVLAVALGLFHWEENRRGLRAWTSLVGELAQRGEQLKRVPFPSRPIPRAENFAEAPLIADLFSPQTRGRANPVLPGVTNQCLPLNLVSVSLNARPRGYFGWDEERSWTRQKRTDLQFWLKDYQALGLVPTNTASQSVADVMLNAFLPFASSLDALRTAAERPDCRYPLGQTPDWNGFPPHLEPLANVSEVLRFRASAELMEGRMPEAFADINLCLYLAESLAHDFGWRSYSLRANLLASALQPLWEGLADGCWSEAQLVYFQHRLAGMDVMSPHPFLVHAAIVSEIDGWAEHRAQRARRGGLRRLGRLFSPLGWTYLNQVTGYRVYQQHLAGLVDPSDARVFPRRADAALSQIQSRVCYSPYLDQSLMTLTHECARTQSALHEAMVACALERYRRQHHAYPEALAALVPEFLDAIPHDILDGAPLRYHRLSQTSFVLYSIGWNGQDDGGVSKSGLDWIWKYR